MFDDITQRRFWAKVDKRGPDECWEWQASTTNGYGRFACDGKMIGAHRYSLMLKLGSVPEHLVTDHLCRNRKCVNPAHLEAVLPRLNSLRGVGGLRGKPLPLDKETHCFRGHERTEKNTRVRPNGRRECAVCHRDRERERGDMQRREDGAKRYIKTPPANRDGGDTEHLAYAGAQMLPEGGEAEIERLRALSALASDGPWEMDREWNEDGEYGSGPNPGRGYDDFLILDAGGRSLFGSENSAAKLIEVEYDEDGGTAWDQVARRNAEFIIGCVAYVRAALAERAR